VRRFLRRILSLSRSILDENCFLSPRGFDRSSRSDEDIVDQVSHHDYCNESLQDATANTDGSSSLSLTVGARIGGLVLWDELRDRVLSDLSDSGNVTI
jgi:hypothetical protein